GITQVSTVPSAAARKGVLSTGSVVVAPSVSRFLQTFYPLPNGPLLGNGDTGIFSFAGQQVTTENYVTAKLDHKLASQDTLSGTFMRDNSNVVQPDAFDELLGNVVSRRQLVTIHEQHIFNSKFLNAARFGFNRAVLLRAVCPTSSTLYWRTPHSALSPVQLLARYRLGPAFPTLPA